MARRVKIKQKKAKAQAGPAPLRLADFAHPGDVKEKTTAFLVGFGGPIGLIMLIYVMPKRDITSPVLLIWAVAAFVVHFWFRPAQELKRAAKNAAASAEDVAFGNVLNMILGRIARLYPAASNVKAVVVPSGVEPVIIGRTVLVPAGLRSNLTEHELFALLAHQVGHVVAGHAVWLNLLRSMSLLPPVLHWISLPLVPLAQMLRRWSYYADTTADRFAVLLTGEGKMVAQAILRLALNAEPSEERVSAEEISGHLARTESLKAEESEIVTHFRLGEYLKERPDLYGRLRQVVTYANSDGCKTALGRLRAAAAPQSASG